MTNRLFSLLAAADLLFFGGWIAREQLTERGPRVKLPIVGYDPRDLLSGHYVRFRLLAESEARSLDAKADEYCLESGANDLMHVTRVKRAESCTPWLHAASDGGPFRFGIDRFYVDERKAASVTTVSEGPDTYLVATLDDDGRIHPIELFVAGRSLGRR